jgi:hypothetical protein
VFYNLQSCLLIQRVRTLDAIILDGWSRYGDSNWLVLLAAAGGVTAAALWLGQLLGQWFSAWARRDDWQAELQAMPPHQLRTLCAEQLGGGIGSAVAAGAGLSSLPLLSGMSALEVNREKSALIQDLLDGRGERWAGRLVPAGARGAGMAAASFFAGYMANTVLYYVTHISHLDATAQVGAETNNVMTTTIDCQLASVASSKD